MGASTVIRKHGISKTFDNISLQQTQVSGVSLFTVYTCTIVACTVSTCTCTVVYLFFCVVTVLILFIF